MAAQPACSTPPTVTSLTMRSEMYWAEFAAVDVVTVMFSRVAVPTGSLADAPTIDQTPAHCPPSSPTG